MITCWKLMSKIKLKIHKANKIYEKCLIRGIWSFVKQNNRFFVTKLLKTFNNWNKLIRKTVRRACVLRTLFSLICQFCFLRKRICSGAIRILTIGSNFTRLKGHCISTLLDLRICLCIHNHACGKVRWTDLLYIYITYTQSLF